MRLKLRKIILAALLSIHQLIYPLIGEDNVSSTPETSLESNPLTPTIIESDNGSVHISKPNKKANDKDTYKVEKHLKRLNYQLSELKSSPKITKGNQSRYQFGIILRNLSGTILYGTKHKS